MGQDVPLDERVQARATPAFARTRVSDKTLRWSSVSECRWRRSRTRFVELRPAPDVGAGASADGEAEAMSRAEPAPDAGAESDRNAGVAQPDAGDADAPVDDADEQAEDLDAQVGAS